MPSKKRKSVKFNLLNKKLNLLLHQYVSVPCCNSRLVCLVATVVTVWFFNRDTLICFSDKILPIIFLKQNIHKKVRHYFFHQKVHHNFLSSGIVVSGTSSGERHLICTLSDSEWILWPTLNALVIFFEKMSSSTPTRWICAVFLINDYRNLSALRNSIP